MKGTAATVTNFTALVFDSGAQWTAAGSDSASGLGALSISGFASGDTIDLTGFAAVSRTFASNALVLTDAANAHARHDVGEIADQWKFVLGNDAQVRR